MRKILLLLLFLALVKYSGAQSPDIKFEHIGVKEGLPEQQIQALMQDFQGYIWIGTQDGLVRYDGYNYKVYNLGTDKLNKFNTTDVGSVIEDKQKVLWVSTAGNGIFKYDRSTGTFKQFPYPASIGFAFCKAGIEDNDNNLWYYIHSPSINAGVLKFNKATGKSELFGISVKGINHINATTIYNPYKTSDGTIWIATNNGLFRYNGPGKGLKGYFTTNDTAKSKAFNPIYEAPSEPGVIWANTFHGNNQDLRITRFDFRNNTLKDYVAGSKPGDILNCYLSAIHEDHKKQLWFALNSAMAKFDRSTGKFTNYILKGGETIQLGDITETARGNFWISSNHGLAYFNTTSGEFKQYDGKDAPPFISNKMMDNTGQLWVGSFAVYKTNYLRSAFHIYKSEPGKPNTYPGGSTQIALANNGNYWLYSNVDVYKWLTATNEFVKTFSNNAAVINAVCQGDGDMLYMATSNGFIAYNTRTHKQDVYKHSATDTNTVSGISVRTIYRDHTGTIWLGTFQNGICSFDPQIKKITRYPYRQGTFLNSFVNDGKLDDGDVGCIYEDPQHTLWVGTNAGGLNKYDPATHKFFSYANANKDMFCVISICAGDSGRIWAGTYLKGLYELDPKSGKIIRHLDQRSGLLHDQIGNISRDTTGNLWMIFERGITRYNTKTGAIQNFKAVTILPNDDMSATQGLNQTPEGNNRLVFSLDNGMVMFDPKSLDANTNPPIVHIEGITYSNPLSDGSAKTIIPYGINNIEVAYNQNRIKFDYIALHFDDPSQNRYAYKLDGYDKDWVQAGTLRSVTYTNLSPGTYTFHVKACNSDGIWNNTGDSITIIIHTSLWMRWWAWLIYIILFAAAIYAFIRYRSRALIRENQQLEEGIAHRTQQLSDANKELSERQQEIITQRDKLATTVDELKTTQQQLIQSEKLASLGELTAGIAHEIQNPLNFVNNFSEVSVELMDEMQTELQNGDKDEAIAISEDIKQNLEKIRHHGKRADAIVKNMLQHSRNNSGERQLTDINALAEEYFRLSYHGLRAKDKSFNSDMVTNLGEHIPKLDIIPQDIGRVLLNLFNNAFYAVQQRKKTAGDSYKPVVTLTTALKGKQVEIRVKDNGTGIPDNVKEKILQPFFTTKPTGEGTGLGLSLSYDIIVKGHGGKLEIESSEGEGSEFIIYLPA